MEKKIKDLEKRIIEIEARNKRVEADKAWETCTLRKILIIVMTYVFVVIYQTFADITNSFLSAVVPCAGFFLSTQSIELIKRKWVEKRNK